MRWRARRRATFDARVRRARGMALACVLALAGCKPQPPANETPTVAGGDPPFSVAVDTKLAPCPATLRVTLPDRFEEPAPGEGDGPNALCSPSGSFPEGTYACLYGKALPHKPLPLIRLSVAPIAAGGKRQGDLDARTWSAYRDRMLGVVKIDAQTRQEVRSPTGRAEFDRSIAREVRAIEPGAPADDAELKRQFPALFAFEPSAAPGGFDSAHAGEDAHASLRRTFYAQGCTVNVEYRVALPGDTPASDLESYVEATTVR